MTMGVTDSSKLVQAQMRLIDVAWGFVSTQAFASAYDLGVFDALTLAPTTLDDVARRIDISPVACRRLLMLLVRLGLVEREGDRFRNSEAGELCSSRSAVPLGANSRMNPFYA